MKPVIVKKLKAYKNWAEWDANLGQQISQAILEIEQKLKSDLAAAIALRHTQDAISPPGG